MKLRNVMLSHTTLVLTVVLALWAVFFYVALIDEVNDEVDDSLEDYAELVIIRSLAGEPLPSTDHGSNNRYYLREVTEQYAASHNHIRYEDRDVYIEEKKEYEPARVLTTIFRRDDGSFLELEVLTPTIEKDDLREAIFYWIIFLYVSLLLIFIVVNAFIFHRNMRPLYALLRWIDNYSLGSKNTPLHNPTGVTEFRTLNEVALRNAQRSERLYEQQKDFIGNASHEMQTPLAICRNRLESLIEEEELTEHQLGELIKIQRTLENMTRLNRSLLLLCKIDNGQFADQDSVALNELVEEFLADLREVYAYKHLSIRVETAKPFVCTMDRSLASVLVGNLLKNAFVYSREGGEITITVAPDSLAISNTGEFRALDPDKVFTRFYHGHTHEGSVGIGLALVHAICRLYNLDINYYYADGLHEFKVSRR